MTTRQDIYIIGAASKHSYGNMRNVSVYDEGKNEKKFMYAVI